MDPALAYDALAPFYDRFTADYEHEPVLDRIETLAVEYGVPGRRLLDVACGTGKSFLPLLRRGYDVTACDLSPRMVAAARRKLAPRDRGRVVVADMRALPWRDAFDLVTCLDDAVNHLLTGGDLTAALGGIASALRPGGVAVFDVNSLRTYRDAFAEEVVLRRGDMTFVWSGEATGDARPDAVCSASLRVRTAGGRELAQTRHVQRHHSRATVEAACARAGLEDVDVRGLAAGAGGGVRLLRDPDELSHRKLLYVARKPKHARR